VPKECFYLGIEGSNTEIVRNGVFWLFENSKSNGSGWIAVNYINNIENISKYPGLNELGILSKNKFIDSAIIQGVRVYLITKYNVPKDGMNKPLLAIHPTKELLNRLDIVPNIPKMMVVAWIAKEVDEWAWRNNAVDYDSIVSSIAATNAKPGIDKVVAVALKHLTNSIKLTKNMSISTERDAIISTFFILVKNGYDLHPDAITNWLVSKCGWGPVAAKQAAEIAENIRSGKQIFSPSFFSTKFWRDNIIEQWKEEAKNT
jgi:hypothetical protein